MPRYFTRWSTAIACLVHQAAREPCMRSCWSAGPKTRWNDQRLRLCSGSWKSSLCCQQASTVSRQWPCAEPLTVLCATLLATDILVTKFFVSGNALFEGVLLTRVEMELLICSQYCRHYLLPVLQALLSARTANANVPACGIAGFTVCRVY